MVQSAQQATEGAMAEVNELLSDAVDAEVGALVGMGPLKRWLAELRAKVEFVGRGADPRLLEGCLNIVLTGNPGAGKTTAISMLTGALTPTAGDAYIDDARVATTAMGSSDGRKALKV